MEEKGVKPKKELLYILDKQKQETNNSPELFKGSLRLDIVTYIDPDTGNKRGLISEVNGTNATFHGPRWWPKDPKTKMQKLFARIRNESEHTVEDMREMKEKGGKDFYSIPHERSNMIGLKFLERRILQMKRMLKSHTLYSGSELQKADNLFRDLSIINWHKHGNFNDALLETFTENKIMQARLIPSRFNVRDWEKGQTTDSKFGYWIFKPNRGGQRKGIFFLTDAQFKEKLEKNEKLFLHQIDSYLVQECVPSSGADNAEGNDIGMPADMNVMVDFSFREDGTIVYSYMGIGMSIYASKLPGNFPIPEFSEMNSSTVPPSEEEVKIAKEAVSSMLETIAFFIYGFDFDELVKERIEKDTGSQI